MRFTYLVTSFALYTALSAAWPWPANLIIRDHHRQIAQRDDPPASSSGTASPKSTAAPSTASATGSVTAPPSASATGDSTNSDFASGTTVPSSRASDKPEPSKGNVTSTISIDPQSPAGGISMINPAPTTTTYYKYGQNITWLWNYTSLVVTPTAVDVLVSCQSLGATYTVASNLSVNATGSVVWDTSKETGGQQRQPDTDKYTLLVYDAGNPAGVSATAEPGKLGVFDQFIFAMYTPQPYTALNDGYMCVACNGALSSKEGQALVVLMTTAMVTVLSFTWFARGFLTI